jgi:hypothetical protein
MRPLPPTRPRHRPAALLVGPVLVLGAAGLLLGLLPGLADPLVQAYGRSYACALPPASLLLVVAVGTAATGRSDFLGVLVAVSLLGFVGTATAGRYVERRGGR